MGTNYYIYSKIYATRETHLGKRVSTGSGKTMFIFNTNCRIIDSCDKEISIQEFIKIIQDCDDISFQEGDFC